MEPPLIPGWDAAGIVDDADPATGYVSGDEVLAIKLPVIEGGGTYAEKIVAPESVTRLPRGHDFAAGSTVLMNGLTALQALDKLDSPAGGVTAVTGGAGVLGGYVLEPAKKRGFRDVLTNNAADTAGGNLVTGEMEAVRRVMEWNCYGTMDVIRAFATVLARNGGGAIVNVLSQSRGSPWTATPLTVQPSQPSGGSPTVCASNWPARERKSSVSCPDSSPRRPCTTSPARPGSNSPKARSPNRRHSSSWPSTGWAGEIEIADALGLQAKATLAGAGAKAHPLKVGYRPLKGGQRELPIQSKVAAATPDVRRKTPTTPIHVARPPRAPFSAPAPSSVLIMKSH